MGSRLPIRSGGRATEKVVSCTFGDRITHGVSSGPSDCVLAVVSLYGDTGEVSCSDLESKPGLGPAKFWFVRN